MARLTSPTGVTVNVSAEKASQLTSVGYVEIKKSDPPAEKPETKKAAPRKRAAKKS